MWRSEADLPLPPLLKLMTTHVLTREYRRIWFWRHSPLMFTVFVCLFLGGIVSEFVQSLLPVRPLFFLLIFNSHASFSVSTRLSNSVTLSCVLHLMTLCVADATREGKSPRVWNRFIHCLLPRKVLPPEAGGMSTLSPLWKEVTSLRYTSQIMRLYRPLSASNSSLNLPSDEEDESGTQLLPLYNKPDTPPSALFPHNKAKKGKGRARSGSLALADVWDEREELFGVGDVDDDDEEEEEEGSSDNVGEEHVAPTPPSRQERQDAPRETKPVKTVRWAEGSA